METRDKAIRLHVPSVPRPGSIRATLAGVMLYRAYVYQPPEAGRGYRQPYPQGVQFRFDETPVARLHYVRAGLGSPVVLVSPGAAWVVAWKHQFRALCENYTVYVVDLPGQGCPELRDPDDFPWDLARMTGALGASWTPCM